MEYKVELIEINNNLHTEKKLSVWFDPLWMNQIAEINQQKALYLIVEKNGNIQAACPLYTRKILWQSQANSPILNFYSPIMFFLPVRKYPNEIMLQKLEITHRMADFLKTNFNVVRLTFNPEIEDMRGFQQNGFHAIPVYTFILNLLQPLNFFKNEKTTLRKAQTFNWEFNEDFRPGEFLDLLYLMYKRKAKELKVNKQEHENLLKKLHTYGMISQYNITNSSEILSANIVLHDNGLTAYDWQTATRKDAMNQGASILLFDKMFTTLKEKYHYLDLCGATAPGPSRLKAALGAELTQIFQIRNK